MGPGLLAQPASHLTLSWLEWESSVLRQTFPPNFTAPIMKAKYLVCGSRERTDTILVLGDDTAVLDLLLHGCHLCCGK